MLYDDLVVVASKARLNKYYRATRNRRRAVQLYFTNIRISGDIFKAISFLEVSIRNRIDTVVTQQMYPESESWLIELYRSNTLRVKEARNTRERIRIALQHVSEHTTTQPSHTQILCELSLGFWSSLFSGYNYMILGSRILKALHPNQAIDPSILRQKLHRLRMVRNRIAHHEPVIFGNRGHIDAQNLKRLLNDIYWIQHYFYPRKLSQIAFYEQISFDVEILEKLTKNKNPAV